MQFLVDLLASGLAVGAVYGLIAMSFAIIYKSTGLLNFAQGEMGMIIAYVAWSISVSTDGNPFIVAIGAIAFAVIFALAVERVAIRPMMGESILSMIMVTIALSVIFRSIVILVWDGLPHNMGITSGNELVSLGDVRVRWAQLVVIGVLFAVANVPYTLKHMRQSDTSDD